MKEAVGVVNHIRTLNPLPQLAIFLFVLSVPVFAAAQSDSFDTPLKKNVVDFGLSENNPPGGHNFRVKLYCFFYPTFVVKEYDNEGQKGAQWAAIVPIQEETTPACTRTHATGERVIEYPEWSGYFKGAKGNLVFFYASDGTNGGMPFVVYDARTGTKIFQDSAFDSTWLHNKVEVSLFNRPRATSTPDGQISLRYLRVVEADCDLYREKGPCWEQVRKKLEVKGTEVPACGGYKNVTTRWISAVAYPVEVSLLPQPTTKAIDGPVKCWPVD